MRRLFICGARRTSARLLTLAAVAVVLPGCALFQRGPEPLDPLGTFEFETLVGGQPTTGTLEITGERSDYTVRMVPSGAAVGPITFSEVRVDDEEWTLHLADNVMGQRLEVELHFVEEDEFRGSWSSGMDGGEIEGGRTS